MTDCPQHVPEDFLGKCILLHAYGVLHMNRVLHNRRMGSVLASSSLPTRHDLRHHVMSYQNVITYLNTDQHRIRYLTLFHVLTFPVCLVTGQIHLTYTLLFISESHINALQKQILSLLKFTEWCEEKPTNSDSRTPMHTKSVCDL